MGVPPTIQAASIGIPDTMLLMLLALVVFGPRRLPEIGRQIGKLMYEFRKVSNDFKFQMEEELRASEEAERQKKLEAQSAARLELNASSQPTLDSTEISQSYTSPEPSFVTSTEAATSNEAVTTPEAAPVSDQAVAVEVDQEPVRGEPRKFPPVMPPSTGEVVEAARPFRGRVPDPVETSTSAVIAEPALEPATDATPVATTNTPAGTEHEANHA